jgi:hypothetical protein
MYNFSFCGLVSREEVVSMFWHTVHSPSSAIFRVNAEEGRKMQPDI